MTAGHDLLVDGVGRCAACSAVRGSGDHKAADQYGRVAALRCFRRWPLARPWRTCGAYLDLILVCDPKHGTFP